MALVSGYAGPPRTWRQRVLAAMKLDVTAFEEVEADTSATMQAAGVVALAAAMKAIGAADEGDASVIIGLIAAIVGWWIWAALTYFIGKTVFNGTATWGELLRTIGFAQSPGLLYLFGIVPILGWFVEVAVGIWILIAGIIAIRQALDITTGKAILTAIIGWAVIVVPPLVLGAAAFFTFR